MAEFDFNDLELRPINLIYKAKDYGRDIEYPKNVAVISPEDCELQAAWLLETGSPMHSRVPGFVQDVSGIDLALCSAWGSELKQLIGLLDITLKFMDEGVKKIVWRYPETFMHPAWQAELGDVLVTLSLEKGE
jgi:hypothetical protein